MNRFLLTAAASLLLISHGSAKDFGPWGAGLGCGGHCLQWFDKIHQHGPLFNYGPYYGYPPFEPYGPWNQYLQYGAASSGYMGGYGASESFGGAIPYSGNSNGSGLAAGGDCPNCHGAPIIRPQLPTATPAPAYGHGGSYPQAYPTSYPPGQAYPAQTVPASQTAPASLAYPVAPFTRSPRDYYMPQTAPAPVVPYQPGSR